jgi:hypothetical protein
MSDREIPNPVCAVVGGVLDSFNTHADLDTLFPEKGAPGEPPPGNKIYKCTNWLKRCNHTPDIEPLAVLGGVLELFMEMDLPEHSEYRATWWAARTRVNRVLAQYGLDYRQGGHIDQAGQALPAKTLRQIIHAHDLAGVAQEFDRAMANIEADPPAAITASCAILEALCKVYIEDEELTLPGDQTLKPLFKAVAADLNFDPRCLQDDDLKRILSGLFSIVDGIVALRTHAGSAHGRGRMRYQVQPRHARLAVNGAHTLAAFVLESWEQKKERGST